jgi:hypothetical protein
MGRIIERFSSKLSPSGEKARPTAQKRTLEAIATVNPDR